MNRALNTIFFFCLNLGFHFLFLTATIAAVTSETKTPANPVAQTTPSPANKAPAKNPAPTTPQKSVQVENKGTPAATTTPADIYKKTCGRCHLAFPPEFLPAASWEIILKDTDHHFGEKLLLEPGIKSLLHSYLKGQSAEFSQSKKAQKILESLNGATPQRLTEVPYLVKKHRKIIPETIKKPAIGSLSNCQACHSGAGQGVFTSKVLIPQ
jgi:cytochrome c5